MKKIISTLLSLVLVIGILPIMASAETTLQGTGVENDPYLISSKADLIAARDMINADADGTGARAAYYELTADVDLQNEAWIPIAPYGTKPFTGSFDGNEHVVRNINIEVTRENATVNYTTSPYLGFFGYIQGQSGTNTYIGAVKDLGLENVSVINNANWVSGGWNNKIGAMGAFAGKIDRKATISGCFVKNATVQNNSTDQTVQNGVGGFYGVTALGSPTLSDCYVYNATVSSAVGRDNYADNLGGFTSQIGGAITLTNCYTAKTVTTAASKANTTFYGFSKDTYKSSSTTISNCLAESDDMPGGRTSPANAVYSLTDTRGTVGMTKEAIIEAMTATANYVSDATVNDGYPCFTWELPDAEPWDGTAAESFAEGDGSAENPYKIYTAAELKLAANTVNIGANNKDREACFILMNDIDYENNAWVPIGYSNASFNWCYKGNFDGNEHVIRNLAISTTDTAYTFCGFFGYVVEAEIKDLGIENIQITMTNSSATKASYIGGFAGRLRGCTVSNCYVKNSLVKQSSGSGTETYGVAGFVSYLDANSGIASVITNCYVYDVDLYCGYGRAQVGFVAHSEGNAVISNCYADATNLRTSSSTHPVYGFGYTGDNSTTYTEGTTATISNCYSTLADTNATATASYGTAGQSVATIAGVFESLNGWQNGDNINNGLPALAWEPAPVAEKDYVVTAVSTAKGTVTLDVNEAVSGAKVYVATYDGSGRLVSADVQNAANGSVPVTVSTADAATVKVFVWNADLTPLADAIS